MNIKVAAYVMTYLQDKTLPATLLNMTNQPYAYHTH